MPCPQAFPKHTYARMVVHAYSRKSEAVTSRELLSAMKLFSLWVVHKVLVQVRKQTIDEAFVNSR